MEKPGCDEVSIAKIAVKKENLNEDIKEFAQNAMNELLGWYGYDTPREDLKISRTCRSYSGSNSSGLSPKCADACGWCGKPVEEHSTLSSGSTSFCSEMCFSQFRRANFKKNKTCDWCRHVKHTVSYVDFQDGASQLQFCSDKCLNQYKMHLFCRETRAHLELHPHLRVEESTSGTLITPDLWLKNCKSPELRSPSPELPAKLPSPINAVASPQPQKLIEVSESKRNRIKNQKKTRKRLPATVTTCNVINSDLKLHIEDAPQDLRVRHTPTDFQSDIPVFKPIKLPLEPRVPSPTPSQTQSQSHSPKIDSSSILRKPFDSLIPPPTIIVPYPIILPIPIPIPIPIPLPIKKEEKVIDTIDSSCQTEEKKAMTVNGDVEVNGKKEYKIIERPLRKRKRTCEPRSKMIMKTRKVILSTN